MANPIPMYQGPAPAAIGMMGQGLVEAGSNIGKSFQQGYGALGQGISQALEQYQSSRAKNDIFKTILQDPELSKNFAGITSESQRKALLEGQKKMIDSFGHIGASQMSGAFLGQLFGAAQTNREFQQKMQLQAMSEGAAMERQKMMESEAYKRLEANLGMQGRELLIRSLGTEQKPTYVPTMQGINPPQKYIGITPQAPVQAPVPAQNYSPTPAPLPAPSPGLWNLPQQRPIGF